MYHFEKKNSKILFPDWPREKVWGLGENVSLGPAVALDGPGVYQCSFDYCLQMLVTYLAFCGMAVSNALAIEAYTREYDRNKVTSSTAVTQTYAHAPMESQADIYS